MLILLSPSKKLDENPDTGQPAGHTQPRLLDDAGKLVSQLKSMAPQELAGLMHLSDRLASLNAARYQHWSLPFTPANARPALFAFRGDVYAGLDADTLSPAALAFAQQHVRILSGLYGVLRPLDLMQAYRLEMGTRLANEYGRDLYAFWGERITAQLNQDLSESGPALVVNLASNEYFRVVKPGILNGRLITPVFRDWSRGQYKVISFFAKKARGLMTRYLIDQRIDSTEGLIGFETAGYAFNPVLTLHPDEPVFTRRQD
ncbi:MAG: peroxide stress protein YaaA [Thiothrix sp.]|nr:peroxide stress protein YaaA [Thiothrix sp.]HPQ97253.1 peroxide stress protein YaaA [Thiolinea sp.]